MWILYDVAEDITFSKLKLYYYFISIFVLIFVHSFSFCFCGRECKCFARWFATLWRLNKCRSSPLSGNGVFERWMRDVSRLLNFFFFNCNIFFLRTRKRVLVSEIHASIISLQFTLFFLLPALSYSRSNFANVTCRSYTEVL